MAANPPSTSTSTQHDLPIVPLLEPPTPDIIDQIVSFHQSSILKDNVLMRFHPPFTPTKTSAIHQFWTTRLSDLPSPGHHVFLALAPPSPVLVSGAATSSGQVVGIIDMLTPQSDTQYFRAEVEMLLVDPEFRGRGVAKRLMAAVEGKAREMGRTLLTLNTTEGCEADLWLYPRLGYKVWGRLGGYGEAPAERVGGVEEGQVEGGQKSRGGRKNGVYYYKDLSEDMGR